MTPAWVESGVESGVEAVVVKKWVRQENAMLTRFYQCLTSDSGKLGLTFSAIQRSN